MRVRQAVTTDMPTLYPLGLKTAVQVVGRGVWGREGGEAPAGQDLPLSSSSTPGLPCCGRLQSEDYERMCVQEDAHTDTPLIRIFLSFHNACTNCFCINSFFKEHKCIKQKYLGVGLFSYSYIKWHSRKILIFKIINVSTTKRHLPRTLPTTEEQWHLPSASAETEPRDAVAVEPLTELRVEWGPLCSRESGGTGL